MSATASVREDAGEVQYVGVVGGDLPEPAIEVLGVGQVAVLLEQDGDRERFFEGDGGGW